MIKVITEKEVSRLFYSILNESEMMFIEDYCSISNITTLSEVLFLIISTFNSIDISYESVEGMDYLPNIILDESVHPYAKYYFMEEALAMEDGYNGYDKDSINLYYKFEEIYQHILTEYFTTSNHNNVTLYLTLGQGGLVYWFNEIKR